LSPAFHYCAKTSAHVVTDHWVLNNSSTVGLAFARNDSASGSRPAFPALELDNVQALRGLHLGIGPVAGCLAALTMRSWSVLTAVEERLVDEHPTSLGHVVGHDQVRLHLVELEGSDLRHITLGCIGFTRL